MRKKHSSKHDRTEPSFNLNAAYGTRLEAIAKHQSPVMVALRVSSAAKGALLVTRRSQVNQDP